MKSKRLELVPFKNDEFEFFYKIVKEDDVGRQLPIGRGYTVEEANNFFEHIQASYQTKYPIWAVHCLETKKIIGYCGLNYIAELEAVEILYSFHPDAWGVGYATEAAQRTLDYAIKTLQLEKLIGLTKPDNKGSRRVLEKIGLNFIDVIDIFDGQYNYYEKITLNAT